MRLTIIIPAYNAENTIKNAIESALTCFASQEILIIDDGSTDSTGKIANKYSCDHNNVKVIHTDNGGVSRARNIGIENASGDYLIFMDADDQIIYRNQLDLDSYGQECDMILFSFNEMRMDGRKQKIFCFADKSIGRKDIVYSFLENKYYFYGPWSKIYKRDIIIQNNLRFNEGQKYGEDVVFVLTYLSCISRGIKLSSILFYTHYTNPSGASFFVKYYNDMHKYLFAQVKAFERLVIATRGNYSEIIDDFACSLFNEAVLHYYLRVGKSEFSERYLECYEIFMDYIETKYLRKYSLFTFITDKNSCLNDRETIRKIYSRNVLLKLNYERKKFLLKGYMFRAFLKK